MSGIVRWLSRIYAYLRLIRLGAKNRFKSIAGMVLSAAAAPLLIAAAFAAAGPTIAGAFTQAKLDLVFCDLEGSSYFDTLLNLMLADESITKTVNVRKLDYGEALAELGAGRADAVVVFPESFISDMAMGINRPVKILGNESDPVRSVFIKEFMQSAAAELSAAQSAINTVWFHMDLEKMNAIRRNMTFTSLTFEYTSKAFARSLYYTFNNIRPTYEGSSPAAFITASALAAFIFFGALSGVRQIVRERETGITVRLAASGVSSVRTAFYHFAPIYFKQLLCACIAAMIALPAVAAATAPSAGDINAASPQSLSGTGGASSIISGVISGAMGGNKNEQKNNDSSDESKSGDAFDIPDGGKGGVRDAVSATPGGSAAEAAGSGGAQPGATPESVLNILKMTFAKENVSRYAGAFYIICVLCLFTSSLTLFAGHMLKRAESAEILITTAGIAMAIAGGTLIPYPYLPEIFKSFGPYCFNAWAQRLIAAALFGELTAGAAKIMGAFAGLALALFAASAIKIKTERI